MDGPSIGNKDGLQLNSEWAPKEEPKYDKQRQGYQLVVL
jgi:hypothetical protein